MQSGYPNALIYLLLLAGVPTAIIRPKWAFLGAVFVLTASNAWMMTMTRTVLLGPYFNANDACLLVTIIAAFSAGLVRIPRIVWMLVGVLMLGFVQSWVVLGWKYEVLRSLRWAMTLPICFVVAANLVGKEEDVRPLLSVLVWGSVAASVQHLLFTQAQLGPSSYITEHDIALARTIAFSNPGVWFMLSWLIWKPKINIWPTPLLVVFSVFFAASIILNQSRSIWLASVACLPIVALWMRRHSKGGHRLVGPLLGGLSIIFSFFIIELLIPALEVGRIVSARIGTLTSEEQRQITTMSRQLALNLELSAWSEGTWVFGRGLTFFLPQYGATVEGTHRVAWGHLGHVTILAQLGLVGLLVYSVQLPIEVIRHGRNLLERTDDHVRFFGLLAVTCMTWSWICFFFSDSFLGSHASDGFIFGAAWGICRQSMDSETVEASRLQHELAQTGRKEIALQ